VAQKANLSFKTGRFAEADHEISLEEKVCVALGNGSSQNLGLPF